ncbi:hypothetical protein HDU93_000592 [Gonapodya sp. JEL0774]|nr:hypothetical protein HDU93_000592 [Gonapodya sp. JEL0774]
MSTDAPRYSFESGITELASRFSYTGPQVLPSGLLIIDFDGSLLSELWFAHPGSLSPPLVPLLPGPEWFDEIVVQAVYQAKSRGDVVVLMTGRRDFMQERVEQILSSFQPALPFDLVILREAHDKSAPGYLGTTLEYKIKVRHVTMYDDRPRHCSRFESELHSLTIGKPLPNVKRKGGSTGNSAAALRTTVTDVVPTNSRLDSYKVHTITHDPRSAVPVDSADEIALVQRMVNQMQKPPNSTTSPTALSSNSPDGFSPLVPLTLFVSLRPVPESLAVLRKMAPPMEPGWTTEPGDVVLQMGGGLEQDDIDSEVDLNAEASEGVWDFSRMKTGTEVVTRIAGWVTVPKKVVVAVLALDRTALDQPTHPPATSTIAVPDITPATAPPDAMTQKPRESIYLLSPISACRSHGARVSKELARLRTHLRTLVEPKEPSCVVDVSINTVSLTATTLDVVFTKVEQSVDVFTTVHRETRLGLPYTNPAKPVSLTLATKTPPMLSVGALILSIAGEIGVVVKGRDVGAVKKGVVDWMIKEGLEGRMEDEERKTNILMASAATESKPAPVETEDFGKKPKTQTLPASWFTNPEVFELERRGLFTKTWLYICHSTYFKKAGDYKLFTVATFPVFLVMGKDGQIRGFHNVCRHRAYPVIKKETGSSTVLGCRYHGWSYDTLGNLVKAPSFDDVPGFKKEDNSLYPIHVHVAPGGLIFVNLEAKETPSVSFQEHFGKMEERLKEVDFDKFEFRETFTMQGKFNWKTLMDGYQCYHCPVAHPGLARDFNISTYRVDPYDHYCIHSCQRKDASEIKKTADAEFTGNANGLWMYVFPNVGINVYSTSWYSIRVNPLSAGETILEYEVFVDKSSTEQEKVDFVKFLKQLELEDFDLCVATQANLEKGIYHEGVLHDFREKGVLYYQGEVRRMLEEHAALEKKAGRKILSASWAPAEVDEIACGGACEPAELKW